MTSGRKFIPEIDGLRFLAITGVVLFHLNGYSTAQLNSAPVMRPVDLTVRSFLELGSFGVQLFFLLSGFVLALPFAKARLGLASAPSLRQYYLRRVTRLEPPYLLALTAIFLIGASLHATGLRAQQWPTVADWPNLVASFFYQHNLSYSRGSRILSAAWSLEVEVQFYILAPLFAAVFSIPQVWRRRSLLLLLVFGIPASRTFLPSSILSIPSLLLYLEWFLAGFLLTDLYVVDWQESPSRSYSGDVLNLAAWVVLLCAFSTPHLSVLRPLLALVAYLGVFRSRAANWLLTSRPITTIGGMCYSIYLLHWHVLSATGFFFRRANTKSDFLSHLCFNMLIALPAVLVIATTFFLLIERPCMDPTWPAKLASKFRQPKLSPLTPSFDSHHRPAD